MSSFVLCSCFLWHRLRFCNSTSSIPSGLFCQENAMIQEKIMHSLLKTLSLVHSNPFWRNILVGFITLILNVTWNFRMQTYSTNVLWQLFHGKISNVHWATTFNKVFAQNKYISSYNTRQLPKYIGKVICMWGFKLHLK